MSELVELFATIAISGGLRASSELTAPAQRFFELIDAQLCAYCMALRNEWKRGEWSLPCCAPCVVGKLVRDQRVASESTAAGAAQCATEQGGGRDGNPEASRLTARRPVPDGLVLKVGRLERLMGWEVKLRDGLEWDVQTAIGWSCQYFQLLPGRLVWGRSAETLQPSSTSNVLELPASTRVCLSHGGRVLRLVTEQQTLLLRAPPCEETGRGLAPIMPNVAGTEQHKSYGFAPTSSFSSRADAAHSKLLIQSWANAIHADCAAQAGRAYHRNEGARSAAVRREPTHSEAGAARTIQRAVRRRLLPSWERPHTLCELALILNNMAWAQARLIELGRRMVSRLPAVLSLPSAELRCSSESCDASCAELCLYIVQRIVYSLLLPHLAHATEGALGGLLTRLNLAARSVALTARAPWRLPLLYAILGTFAMALDARLRAPSQFALLVNAATTCVLPHHQLRLLCESFADEGCELDQHVQAVVDEDHTLISDDVARCLDTLKTHAESHEWRRAERVAVTQADALG